MSLERQVRIAAGALACTGGVLAVAVSPWFGLLPAFIGAGLVWMSIGIMVMRNMINFDI